MRGLLLILAQSIGGCLGAVLVLATIPNSTKVKMLSACLLLTLAQLSRLVSSLRHLAHSFYPGRHDQHMPITLSHFKERDCSHGHWACDSCLNIFSFSHGRIVQPGPCRGANACQLGLSVNFLLYILAPIAGAQQECLCTFWPSPTMTLSLAWLCRQGGMSPVPSQRV